MMETLSQFITRRKAEIRKQISALRAEYKSLKAAESATSKDAAPKEKHPSSMTIKDMIKIILSDMDEGANAHYILHAINSEFGKNYQRPSLSPQLSRLKKEGFVSLRQGKWVLSSPEFSIQKSKSEDDSDAASL